MKEKLIRLIVFSVIITYSCKQDVSNKAINYSIIGDTIKSISLPNTEPSPITKDSLNDIFSEFIPQNYSLFDVATGNLNLDTFEDNILVLKKVKIDTLSGEYENHEIRPLLILTRDKNNKLQLAKRNDNAIYFANEGGMMGDPFSEIVIKDGFFSIEHFGGSAWRWHEIRKFKFSRLSNDWFLNKISSSSFHSNNPEEAKVKIRTMKDFGKIKFEDFDIDKEY